MSHCSVVTVIYDVILFWQRYHGGSCLIIWPFPSSYIFREISQSSCTAFSPKPFTIFNRISFTPAAFSLLIFDIGNRMSLFHTPGSVLLLFQPTSLLSLAFHLCHIRTRYIHIFPSFFHFLWFSYCISCTVYNTYILT